MDRYCYICCDCILFVWRLWTDRNGSQNCGVHPLSSGGHFVQRRGTLLAILIEGSLLFSLFINNIMVGIESEIRLFADDCVCYRQIDSTENTSKLQKDIHQLGKWARKWGMRFSAREM